MELGRWEPTPHWDESITKYLQPALAVLSPEQTVEEALEVVRAATLPERIVYFYVVDFRHRLVGVVPTRRLLGSRRSDTVERIMVTDMVTLSVDATVYEASSLFHHHRFLALPVVDGEGRLEGTVDIGLFADDQAVLADHQNQHDVFQLIGVHLDLGRQSSSWRSFLDRFPWLGANIMGGLLCAWVSSRYEALLDSRVILALFIPVTLAVAESVSIQSMTLTLQQLHVGREGDGRLWRTLAREWPTALLLGLATGAAVASAVALWQRDLVVAGAILVSITLAMLTASVLGVVLPTTVHALGRDPRVAAGPIVLATADVATLLFYFNIAGWLLSR